MGCTPISWARNGGNWDRTDLLGSLLGRRRGLGTDFLSLLHISGVPRVLHSGGGKGGGTSSQVSPGGQGRASCIPGKGGAGDARTVCTRRRRGAEGPGRRARGGFSLAPQRAAGTGSSEAEKPEGARGKGRSLWPPGVPRVWQPVGGCWAHLPRAPPRGRARAARPPAPSRTLPRHVSPPLTSSVRRARAVTREGAGLGEREGAPAAGGCGGSRRPHVTRPEPVSSADPACWLLKAQATCPPRPLKPTSRHLRALSASLPEPPRLRRPLECLGLPFSPAGLGTG